MTKYRKHSSASIRVLNALYDAAPTPLYGMEIMDVARMPSGSLYPILARFRERGWLEFEVEPGDPANLGRPTRTYYKLSADGLAVAAAAAQESPASSSFGLIGGI